MKTKHVWGGCGLLYAVAVGLFITGLASCTPSDAKEEEEVLSESAKQSDAQDEDEVLRTKAEQGDAKAQYTLGNKLLCGKKELRNEEEGAKWIRLSAEQGYLEAISEMGFCYMDGRGVPMNKKLGEQWLLKAAIGGDGRAMAHLRMRGYTFAEIGGSLIYTTPNGNTHTVPLK